MVTTSCNLPQLTRVIYNNTDEVKQGRSYRLPFKSPPTKTQLKPTPIASQSKQGAKRQHHQLRLDHFSVGMEWPETCSIDYRLWPDSTDHSAAKEPSWLNIDCRRSEKKSNHTDTLQYRMLNLCTAQTTLKWCKAQLHNYWMNWP